MPGRAATPLERVMGLVAWLEKRIKTFIIIVYCID